MFFLIDPNFLNEENLRFFGHNSLVNYLENIYEKQEEYGITKVLKKITSRYGEIKYIRKKISINNLFKEYKKFLIKLKRFKRFFELYKNEIIDYLNSKEVISRELADSERFIHLAELFYNYIDSLNILDKDLSYGY